MRKLLISLLLLSSLFTISAEERAMQFSFITPIGTNGLNSNQTTNKFSLNLIGGYSAANEILELGSVYNINLEYTKGVQMAGVVNYTGNSINAIQMAGVTNISTNGKTATQLAGVFNYAVDSNKTIQLAGVTNISTKGKSATQLAGVMNYSGNSYTSVQIAGVLNIAKEVSGVQIGLINIADSCTGVPIGLINIVKDGGKHEFELAFSETLNTSVSFKLGTNTFYSIFSGGVNFLSSTPEYAAGIGFGTEIKFRDKSWGNQIEVLGYGLTTNGKFAEGLNMLTQLKYSVSKEFTPHFKVFAGPTFNLTISDDCEATTHPIAPWSMYSSNNGTTALNGWIGLSAGVRF
ncbi:MAG: hypothetical protein R3Y22_05995 [Bacteroidales bacterium]